MKKRLFSILIAGLTLMGTARSASATSSLPATPSVTIDGQPIPVPVVDPTTAELSTPVATPSKGVSAPAALATPAANNQSGGGIQSSITSAINAPVGNIIQSASASLTNFAAQQTSGITSTLSNIPLVGNQINTAIQQQISSGINGLTTMATKGFSDLLANSPLAGFSSAISSALSSLGFGGGSSSPNTASTQAAAQTAAIRSTVDSYQTGASQAAALLAQATNPDIGSIQTGLANTTPAGNIGSTLANVQGQQAVANITLNNNPTSGSLSQLDAISSSSNQVVAQSANGVAGQADLQSRVSAAGLNAAGMQAQATQTYDNSLDQLNAISQQIGQQGAINAESVRIAAEQRTLTAAQLAQSASDATARIRKEQAEDAEKQSVRDGIFNGRAAILGMTGAIAPSTPVATPAPTTTPSTTSVVSTLLTPP
jgi:hypothetical protein